MKVVYKIVNVFVNARQIKQQPEVFEIYSTYVAILKARKSMNLCMSLMSLAMLLAH